MANTRLQTTSRVPTPRRIVVKGPKGDSRIESVNVPQTGGNIDQIRLLATPYGEKLAILDEVMFDFSWAEDASDLASVQAEISFHNLNDFAKKTLSPGTWIFPQYFNPTTGSWVNLDPPLYIWDRERTDRQRLTASVTAFDIVSFVNRQDTSNWLFKGDKQHKNGWYAHEIAQTILFDFEIRAKLVKGKYKIPYLYLQGHNPFETIIKAYTRDRQISNILYRVQAIGKQFTVLPYTKQDKVWIISDKSNLISSSWNESLDGVKTEVVVITSVVGGDNSLITGGARATSDLVRKYGRLREVIYLEKKFDSDVIKKFAREALKYVSKTKDTISIQAEGLIPMRAGDAVVLDDSGTDLHGTFFVKTITHTVSSGQHLMDIELNRSAIVPALFPSREELRNGGTAILDPKRFKAPIQSVGTAAAAAASAVDGALPSSSSPSGSTFGPQDTNPKTTGVNPDLRRFARACAIGYNIDADLFEKQIQQENGFKTTGGSSAGARGIAQIVPRFHPDIAPYIERDPKKELNWAAYTMAKLLVSYNRRWDLALSGYNAGPGAVAEAGNNVPPFKETRDYVLIITGRSSPTTQPQGPAPNRGGALTFPPGVS